MLGIEIVECKNFPIVNDFYNDKFYLDNFSKSEIDYCLKKSNPIASFAGKLAAKEAITKVGRDYSGVPFKKIVIGNDETGKPIFKDFSISISHTVDYAVAIAIKFVD